MVSPVGHVFDSDDVNSAIVTVALLVKEVNKPFPGGFVESIVEDMKVTVTRMKDKVDGEDLMKAAFELARLFIDQDRAPGEFLRYEVGDNYVQVWRKPDGEVDRPSEEVHNLRQGDRGADLQGDGGVQRELPEDKGQ
jgi:hypothetical protein